MSKVQVYYIGTECGRILTENPGGDYWKAVVEKHHADKLAEALFVALSRTKRAYENFKRHNDDIFFDDLNNMINNLEQALKNYQEGE